MSKREDTYSGSDIKVLDDREHVRIRTQLYLGNMHPATFKLIDVRADSFKTVEETFVPAAYKAVGEIIDNSIDELVQIDRPTKQISIDAIPAQGQYVVSDTGRGVPIDKHETGIHTPQVVYGSLRSGRNFKDDKAAGVQGMNGVGSAVTNFTSEYFNVTVHRDNKEYKQQFTNGGSEVTVPAIKTKRSTATGTTVEFKLDGAVFKDVSISEDVSELRAHYIALANPGLTVTYNGNKIRYKTGFAQYVSKVFDNYFQLTIEEEKVFGNIFIIPTSEPVTGENVFTWVNSSFLLDGGLCNVQIVNAFSKKVSDQLAAQAKRAKGTVNMSYVKQKFIVIADLKISDPSYDNQAKTRLTNPDIRRELTAAIDEQWAKFVRSNKDWLDDILSYSVNTTLAKDDDKAVKELEDTIKRAKRAEGLIDATSTKRSECRLLVTEGKSAKSTIQEARSPATDAALDMSGKFNNVYDSSPAQVIGMKKLKDLLATIGLIPGRPADRSKLRYGKFVISVDADYDGQDIFSNYINLFYKFWPELLDPNETPFVYKLIVPNVVVSKGKQRIHFKSRPEFEAVASQYKGWDVEYMKGLGSMSLADWKMVLSSPDYELPIVSDDQMAETMELLFGPDADKRKAWLSTDETYDDLIVDGSEPVSSAYVRQLRREYALYTLTDRAIPYASDGLTASIRRNVWKGRSGKQFKTETLAGITMSIHPHSSSSGVISTAAAYYQNNIPLMAGDGAFGTRLDPGNHGAPRYTKVAVSDFCKDVMLADVDIIPMIDNYDHMEQEPAHLLPLVPYGLINPSEGIAIGYKASITPRHPEAIIEAQLAILQNKRINEDSLIPTFLPMESIAGDFKDTPKGRTYYFYGTIERLNATEVKITTLPYGLDHDTLVSKLDMLWDTGQIHSYVDDSAAQVNIKVKFQRGVLSKKTDTDIIKELGLIGSESEIMFMIDFNGNSVISDSIPDIIKNFTNWRLGWYLTRYQKQLDDQLQELTRLYDIRKAIVGKLEQKARKLKSRAELKEEVIKLKIVNVDYIADLPVYRFTEEEHNKNELRIAEAESKLKTLQDMVDKEDLRKKQYITELKAVLKNVKAGKYYPEIWYKKATK